MSMPGLLYHKGLFSEGANSTTDHPSIMLASSSMSLNHSEKATDQDAVDINLSLNSGYSANNLTRNQAIPILGQLGLHQHVAQGRFWRKDLAVPNGIHSNSTANIQPIPKNIVNHNMFMGNNPSANINLPNKSPPLQFTRNDQFTSSSIGEQIRNNIVSVASSSFKQLFVTLASNQENKWSNMSDMTESSHITSSYSPYTSPSVSALTGKGPSTYLPNYNQKLPTAIPYLRQEQYSSAQKQLPHNPLHSSDFQHHAASQSNSNLSLFNLQSSCFTSENEKHYHLPRLLGSKIYSSNNGQTDFENRNNTLPEGIFHSQPNLLAPPESQPATGHVSNQDSGPSAKHPHLHHSHPQPLPQAHDQNAIVTRPQQNLAQNISPNHTIDLNAQAQGRQRSAVRRKSHPYIKYGPYNCPLCHVIFDNRYRFAAHFQKHYRDESPMEKKRRRESKIRNRDLCIKKSTAGITVIPKSLHMEDKLLVTSDIRDAKAIKTKKEEGFASVKIKKEAVTDNEN